jgi:hypothetical protein
MTIAVPGAQSQEPAEKPMTGVCSWKKLLNGAK